MHIARHLLEAFVRYDRLISSRENGPGVDTGDILCHGYVTRGAVLPLSTANPWDWLDRQIAWQSTGLRPAYQPPPLPDPEGGEPLTMRPRVIEQPAGFGACWLGDLSLLQSPGVLPAEPHGLLAGTSLVLAGGNYGAGGIGAEVQPELGEAISIVVKLNRVLVIDPGDTLLSIAERYGETVQSLRLHNPPLQAPTTVLTVAGDTPSRLAGRHGTTVTVLRRLNGWLRQQLELIAAEGDNVEELAARYGLTTPVLREANAPELDAYGFDDPLPAGMVLRAPAIATHTPLEPGQALVVPVLLPTEPLEAGSWLALPRLRGPRQQVPMPSGAGF
ncbi:MAG: LysM peptidoglycan-binding domain-containing protein [Cyanobium sp. PLM2.Bin73]|nr:MAG: LysM peptidoglycan-binding domain-containing protein [Cyanobium sp. PLM2.Bin73]